MRRLLLIAGAAGAVLTTLTVLVAARAGSVLRADTALSDDAVDLSRRHGGVLATARVVTQLGSPVTVNVVAVIAVVVLLWRRRAALAVLVGLVRLVALGLEQALKYGIDRARPVPTLAHAGGPSFPSGHSTGAAALLTLAVVAVCASGRGAARWAAMTVLVAAMAAVAASRVFLGVHYPTDVLAGVALGVGVACAGVALLVVSGYDAARSRPAARAGDGGRARAWSRRTARSNGGWR